MDTSNHRQRQRAPPGQDFRDSRARSDERLELFSGPTELLAPQGDRLYASERLNRKCPTLVRIDECRECVEFTLLPRARLRIPELLDASKGFFVAGGIDYRLDHFTQTLLGSMRSYSA